MLMNKLYVRTVVFVVALMVCGVAARGQDADVSKKLQGFDAYMEQTLKGWNTPGVETRPANSFTRANNNKVEMKRELGHEMIIAERQGALFLRSG